MAVPHPRTKQQFASPAYIKEGTNPIASEAHDGDEPSFSVPLPTAIPHPRPTLHWHSRSPCPDPQPHRWTSPWQRSRGTIHHASRLVGNCWPALVQSSSCSYLRQLRYTLNSDPHMFCFSDHLYCQLLCNESDIKHFCPNLKSLCKITGACSSIISGQCYVLGLCSRSGHCATWWMQCMLPKTSAMK